MPLKAHYIEPIIHTQHIHAGGDNIRVKFPSVYEAE